MTEKIALKGNLDFTSLPDLFQILGGNASTGTLHLKSRYAPQRGHVYFLKGSPIDADLGPRKGLESVYALFGWTEGEFEFHNGEINMAPRIEESRMEIVLDALRLLDDGKIEKVGPPSVNKTDIGDRTGKDNGGNLPVITGPLVDYGYVVGEESFADGKKIVQEGGHGKWLGVIYEGIVRIQRETTTGSLDIVRLGTGSYIGTFRALLFGDYSRSASICAEGNVGVYTLNADQLHKEYTSLSADFQKLLLSLDERLIRMTDRAADLNQCAELVDGNTGESKTIMACGTAQRDLYIIREGEARIVGNTQKGPQPIAALGKDDVFGYNPFMDIGHEPRAASVLGYDGLKVDKLDPDGMQREYDGLSKTLKNMILHVGNCITMTTQVVYRLYNGAGAQPSCDV